MISVAGAIWIFIGSILSFWLSAVCGGGASLVLIPLLNLFVLPSHVPFTLTVGTFTSSASRILVFSKHINWRIFWWFVPCSIPAVWLGVWLIRYVNPLYLELAVAIFLLANVTQLLQSKKRVEETSKPYKDWVLGVVGFFAGFVSGVTGAIGLLFNRFYLNYGMSKEQIIATRAANEVVLHLIKLTLYIMLGVYSRESLYLGLFIAAASVLSAFTVKYILPYISEYMFRKIGYAMMVLSGIFLLVGTSVKIIAEDNMAIIPKRSDTELLVNWRGHQFSLDFSFKDGFHIEVPLSPAELPSSLQATYQEITKNADAVTIEKVYSFLRPVSYEFHQYRDKKLTIMEFAEHPEE